MKSPPAGIRLVLEALCVLRGIKPFVVLDTTTGKKVEDYWKSSLRMLTEAKFLDSLITFDKVRGSLSASQLLRKKTKPVSSTEPQS